MSHKLERRNGEEGSYDLFHLLFVRAAPLDGRAVLDASRREGQVFDEFLDTNWNPVDLYSPAPHFSKCSPPEQFLGLLYILLFPLDHNTISQWCDLGGVPSFSRYSVPTPE